MRDVMDDDERDRLVGNLVGHLLNGVSEPCWLARSSTGATSTRTSATRLRRASGPGSG